MTTEITLYKSDYEDYRPVGLGNYGKEIKHMMDFHDMLKHEQETKPDWHQCLRLGDFDSSTWLCLTCNGIDTKTQSIGKVYKDRTETSRY